MSNTKMWKWNQVNMNFNIDNYFNPNFDNDMTPEIHVQTEIPRRDLYRYMMK